jgi:hypothetical protein
MGVQNAGFRRLQDFMNAWHIGMANFRGTSYSDPRIVL